MKFWQIAAAILMFKAFDVGVLLASEANTRMPIAAMFITVTVWLILSIFIWAAFSLLERPAPEPEA